jgi:hypothetical protein
VTKTEEMSKLPEKKVVVSCKSAKETSRPMAVENERKLVLAGRSHGIVGGYCSFKVRLRCRLVLRDSVVGAWCLG